MKKVLLLGGSGSLGRIFIKNFNDVYDITNFSRNENSQNQLFKEFPNIKNIIGSITDRDSLTKAYLISKPDIVIHAAAMKHIDIAEKTLLNVVILILMVQ